MSMRRDMEGWRLPVTPLEYVGLHWDPPPEGRPNLSCVNQSDPYQGAPTGCTIGLWLAVVISQLAWTRATTIELSRNGELGWCTLPPSPCLILCKGHHASNVRTVTINEVVRADGAHGVASNEGVPVAGSSR